MKEFDIHNYKQTTQGNDNLEKDWVVLRFKAHTLYLHLQAIAATDLAFKVNHQQLIELQEGKTVWAGYRRSDLVLVTKEVIKKTKENPTWIDDYSIKFWKLSDQFKKLAEELYFDTPNNQLKSKVLELVNAGLAPQRYGYVTICANIPGNFWVENHLKELDPELTSEQINLLLSPNRPSFLARFYEKVGNEIKSNILREFFYIKASYWRQEEVEPEDLFHQSIEGIEKPSMKKEVADFVHVMEKFIAMQDERKANALRMCMCLHKIATHISEKMNYSLDELENMTIHEFLRVVEGKAVDKMKINTRKNCLWNFRKKEYWATDSIDEAKKFLQATGSLEGRIACEGCISGKVKVVLSEDDFSKVNEGDILVTSMTRPEFLPVMRKVAAFVTAEGGVTCHAAIIAREMGKPCITSVRGALDLKDGDLVEVDADKGIVRKING